MIGTRANASKTARPAPASRALSGLRSFLRHEAGNIGIVFALAMIPLTGAVGGAVDFTSANALKSRLQRAADAAALDAAMRYGTSGTIDTAGFDSFFAANLGAAEQNAAVQASLARSSDIYTVDASAEYKPHFLGLLGIQSMPIAVTASAQVLPREPMCVIVMEPTEVGAYVNSDARLEANCGMHVNSTNTKAAEINSRAHVVTTQNYIVGGVYTNSSSSLSPAAIEAEPAEDPMAGFALPAEASDTGCDYTDYEITKTTETLYPGTYCGLKLNNGAVANLEPGIYLFRGGTGLDINADAEIHANGASLYFADGAPLKVNSRASLSVSAPESGPSAGIAIFQTESAAGAEITINAAATGTLNGLLYAPETMVTFNSDSSGSATPHALAMIVGQIYINSGSTLSIGIDPDSANLPASLSSSSTASGARLVR